jgi:formylglycine-generating enzyme required for sulfatase activity
VLVGAIDTQVSPTIPSADDSREALAKRQANAAAALIQMNHPAKAWDVLKHRPDPRARSYLIQRLSPLGVEAGTIIKRLDEEKDVTIRRALLLSLGEYDDKGLPPEERQRLVPRLQALYRTDADPGLHAACEWLLRTWQQGAWLNQVTDEWAQGTEEREKRLESIQQSVTRDREKAPPQWYVNGQGQTMVVIPGPVEFVMGSPPAEKGRFDSEPQHKKRIARTFALAAKLVTVEQYRRSDVGYQLPAKYKRMAELPVAGTSWYQAAAYCNWLSKREGIDEDQWCYETDAQGQVTRLKPKYLNLAGYRLPTEAEMEYATRAGAVTSRYYGETEELLPRYAWYLNNAEAKTWPVGRLRPNDLGLFDAQGNLFTWCQERYLTYPLLIGERVFEDKKDDLSINNDHDRVLRGGSFFDLASVLRSAVRDVNLTATRRYDFGFRPARTLPPGTITALPPTSAGGRK